MSADARLLLDPRALLSRLVAIASPSGAEAACGDFLEETCRAAQLDVERVGAGVLVRFGKRGPECARFLLVSHIDTVPVGNGWLGDPLDGTWRDGKLVARGANDAKASCAAMLCAAAQLARGDLGGELLVALNACEETNNLGMRLLLDTLAADGRGLPDAAVVGEPTSLEVVRAQAGLVVLEAHFDGKSCHAAHVARVEHENALLKAARALAALPDYFALPGEHPLLGKSTIVATMLKAGERHNVVPDRAELVFDARLAPPHDAASSRALLEENLPGARVVVRSDRMKAFETPAEHPLVREALRAAGKPAPIGSSTMSDMALLQGVPAIKCGPGATARSHTPNEWIEAHELDAGVRFYCELVTRVLPALEPRALARSLKS